jgi:hypothetical protein
MRRATVTSALGFVLVLLVTAVPPARAAREDHPISTARPEAALDEQFTTKTLTKNRVGLTITNYGFVGNNFVTRSPSFEYPYPSGFEHMVRGGIWIGAIGRDENTGLDFAGVSSAAVDASQGSGGQNGTEFSPNQSTIDVRSSDQRDPTYDPTAVSQRDFITSFRDYPPKYSGDVGEPPRPLNVVVRQENYAWNFSDFAHFAILHYVIKTTGLPLRDVWVGFYSELASGNRNAYSCWGPSSGCSSVGGWYSKKLFAWDDSLRLEREHFCFGQPVPNGCKFENVPFAVGIKLLTPPDTARGQKVTFAAWNYNPGDDTRDEDIERYAIMSTGTATQLTTPDLQQQTGDPVTLLAVGPFARLDPGDSIVVDFALVGGAAPRDTSVVDIHQHARVAQRAFDEHYQIPNPPPSPLLKVVSRERALDLFWEASPETTVDRTSPDTLDFEGYRVYIGEEKDRLDLRRLAQFDISRTPHDTTGFNTGLGAIRLPTPIVIDGVTYQYKYSIEGLKDGFKYFVAVTSYDLGSNQTESLESGQTDNQVLAIPGPTIAEKPGGGGVTVFPNPYRVEASWDRGTLVRDHYLWFANLPSQCTIRIYTLSGDLVFETFFDGSTYAGGSARGIYDPVTDKDVAAPTLSGTTFGWNMITQKGEAAATGLYLYSVEPKGGGKRTVGKFLIVKSDRENF